MKRLLAIFLLLSLIAPLGGAYLGFRAEKTRIKKAVKRQLIAGISKDELVEFKILTSDTGTVLHWIHDGEFEFKGKMYDIVERNNDNDSVTYWCWCDNYETQLNKEYTTLVAKALGNNPQKNGSKQQLIDYLKTLFYPGAYTHQNTIYISVTDTFLSNYKLYKNSWIKSPAGPPPKFRLLSV
jgi:hypothetical protein